MAAEYARLVAIAKTMRAAIAVFSLIPIASALQTPEPTFHARTELVQINVLAKDKQGKPISDLRREEFQIYDNSSPREIQVFVPETAGTRGLSHAVESVTPERGVFTNRISSPTSSHSGYSVILIDDLFTEADPVEEEGSTLARIRTLEMLRSMDAGEKIAIYALRQKFQVICEFTSDRDLLEHLLRQWKPHPETPADMRVVPGQLPVLPGRALPPLSGEAAREAIRIDALQRTAVGDAEMESVADHLAGIPGRKNLIFLSNRFVIGPRAIQKLIGAGVAIYPIDLDGVCRLCPPRPTALMDNIAAITGGVAYYKRNDIALAIREAMNDGAVSYTLGFYSADDNGPPLPHRLVVKVNRPGVALRYRTSYEQGPPHSVSANPVADMVEAMNRPVDATAVSITATAVRTNNRLNLDVGVPIESLGLEHDRDSWAGRIEVVARFTTADGLIAANPSAETLTLNLRQETWDNLVRNGFVYRAELQVPPKAVELKLLVGNPASGKIGTLTIPLAKIGLSSMQSPAQGPSR